MKREKPILQILANRLGVYEVGVRTPADEYPRADRLSTAIRPAIEIIDRAIYEAYGETFPKLGGASAPHSREEEKNNVQTKS